MQCWQSAAPHEWATDAMPPQPTQRGVDAAGTVGGGNVAVVAVTPVFQSADGEGMTTVSAPSGTVATEEGLA